jgi:hypothetical protein
MAQSGHDDGAQRCLLLGVKRTSRRPSGISIHGFRKSSGQLRDIRRDPPRLVFGEQLGRRSYRPILPAFAIIVPESGGLWE